MKFRFIHAEKARYPVRVLCRVLEVSRSGFYAWCRRAPARRVQAEQRLTQAIQAAHRRSRGTYGSPRLHAELKAQGLHVSRKRVARLMRDCGLRGVRPHRRRRTTLVDQALPVADNLVARDFDVTAPNQVWAADITYVRTWEGWLYLAVVLDLFSRRVVGWAMADHLRTDLPLQALAMALGQRLPETSLVHHSDRGCQYASERYRQLLDQRGIRCSMSRRGDCWDNAVVESFFATLKSELLDRRPWPTHREARLAIHQYIGVFYNRHRRHSYLHYSTPACYEQEHELTAMAA